MVSVRRYPRRRMGWFLKLLVSLLLLGATAVVYLTQVADRGFLFSGRGDIVESVKTGYLKFMRDHNITRIVAEEGKYSLAGIRLYKKGFFWSRSIDRNVPRNSGFVLLRKGDRLVLKTNAPVNQIYMEYMGNMLTVVKNHMRPKASKPVNNFAPRPVKHNDKNNKKDKDLTLFKTE